MTDERKCMAKALEVLQQRLRVWLAAGLELQEQVTRVAMAVFLDNRPLTAEEQAWVMTFLDQEPGRKADDDR